MVPVIIDHTHPRDSPTEMESPVHSAELVESGTDRLHSDIESHTNGNRRRRVQYVMDSRDMQRELAQVLFPITHSKVA